MIEQQPTVDMYVYLDNCTPYNGHHAVRFADGAVVYGYAFTDSNGDHAFAHEAVMVDTNRNVVRRRTAPAYLGCCPPKHHWEPSFPKPARSLGEMPAHVIVGYFAEADRLLKEEY